MHSVFTDRGVRFLHGVAAEGDLAILHFPEIHGRDVLGIRVECHLAGDTAIAFHRVQRIANLAAIQAGATDGIEQDIHRVEAQRGEGVGLAL